MRNTQVFLKDKNVMAKIVSAAKLEKTDIVLEIGSGDGRLTREIAPKVKTVYAIERDINLLDASKMALKGLTNISFVHGDALEVNFAPEVNKIVSNLPYAISSPITTKIIYFLNKRPGSFAVLMYQKEFGERMLAIPGLRDYSMLSVFSQYTSEIEKITNVNKKCFRPTPSVDSVVLRLTPRHIDFDEGFLSFCRLLFQHKKKNLYSSIIDSRAKLAISSKEGLREKLLKVEKDDLKRKVFFFEAGELINIYNTMLKIGVCQK